METAIPFHSANIISPLNEHRADMLTLAVAVIVVKVEWTELTLGFRSKVAQHTSPYDLKT